MSQSQAFIGRIAYSDGLLRQLEDALSTRIANAKGRVRLSRRPRAWQSDHFYCGLEYVDDENCRRYTQPDSKAANWVLTKAIRRGASTASVWLGVRLRFENEAESAYLTSASIVVLVHRQSLFPLVRAEWDYRGVHQARHAQPHWHVLTALQAQVNVAAKDMGPPIDFTPAPGPEGSDESESLHLAMSADWADAKGNRHIWEMPTAANLRNWIDRTVNYSIEQVQYALNKSSKVATQEFIPQPVR